uniref:Uncharacterized protein n=1 Tax=Physcomitrium patens TaxID=3218 RepID=A0A7I4A719_PHYPA
MFEDQPTIQKVSSSSPVDEKQSDIYSLPYPDRANTTSLRVSTEDVDPGPQYRGSTLILVKNCVVRLTIRKPFDPSPQKDQHSRGISGIELKKFWSFLGIVIGNFSENRLLYLITDELGILPSCCYNGSALIAMVEKNCLAIASDRRLGVNFQTIACDFLRIFKIYDNLYISL